MRYLSAACTFSVVMLCHSIWVFSCIHRMIISTNYDVHSLGSGFASSSKLGSLTLTHIGEQIHHQTQKILPASYLLLLPENQKTLTAKMLLESRGEQALSVLL